MKVNPVPEDMHRVTPHLICAGAAQAIEFYKKAFGAVEQARLFMPEWGPLSPKSLKGSPVTLHLYVEDVDAVVERAAAAGATVTMPVADMFWGDRYGKLEDPFGHHWSVATQKRRATMEEMQQAMRDMSQAAKA